MTPRASIYDWRGAETHRHAKTSCRAREFVRDSLELKMAPLFSSCFERVSGKRSDFDRFGRLAAFTGARVGLAARRRGDAMSRTFTPVESSNRPPHDCGKNPFCVICPETGRRSRPRRRGRRMNRATCLPTAPRSRRRRARGHARRWSPRSGPRRHRLSGRRLVRLCDPPRVLFSRQMSLVTPFLAGRYIRQ